MTFPIGVKVVVREGGMYRPARTVAYEPAMKPLAATFTRVHIDGDHTPRLIPHHKITAWDARLAGNQDA